MQTRRRSGFGGELRSLRLAMGLSQEALAERARVSVDTISALERGARRAPYRETVAMLAEALGLEPAQRVALETVARMERTRKPGVSHARTGNLPSQRSSFIGREADVAAVMTLLRAHRTVTLVGAGGIGKTRVAFAVASELALHNPDGVWFVDFAPVADPARLVAVCASTLGAPDGTHETTLGNLVDHVARRTLLIVLDNCEHVIGDAAALAESLVGAGRGVRVVTTSRERLGIVDEAVYRLGPLPHGSAVALFRERAMQANSALELSDDLVHVVGEICRRLDGIPLALELAAARAGVLSIADIARRLDDHLRLLVADRRGIVPRHQTMRATVDWSHDLLEPAEQRLLRRVAIFAGGWTLEAAEVACADELLPSADVLDLLTSLVAKSLVIADVTALAARYRLLEATRAYAAEKLDDAGETQHMQRRRAQWMATYADLMFEELQTASQEQWLVAVEREAENARAAIEWGLSPGGDAVLAGRIASGLSTLWSTGIFRNEGASLARRALDALETETHVEVEARLWRALATTQGGMHSADAALQAIRLYERLGDRHGLAHAYRLRAHALRDAQRLDAADDAAQRAIELYRETGLTTDRRYLLALQARAAILFNQGHIDEARDLLNETLSIDAARLQREDLTAAAMHGDLAELEYAAGDLRAALRLAARAAALTEQGENTMAFAIAHVNLAAYQIAAGDLAAALSNASEALRSAQDRYQPAAAAAIQHLATLAALRGDSKRGALLLGYVDAWYGRAGSARGVTEQKTYELALEALRKNLAQGEIVELLQRGAALTQHAAVRQALVQTAQANDSER